MRHPIFWNERLLAADTMRGMHKLLAFFSPARRFHLQLSIIDDQEVAESTCDAPITVSRRFPALGCILARSEGRPS